MKYSSNAKRPWSKRGVYAAAQAGIRMAKRFVRSRVRTRQREGEGPSNAISTQFDSKLLYRRRRAPRGVRRRARRRFKRFESLQLKNRASQTNLFQVNSLGYGANAPGTQNLFTLTSGYTWCGTPPNAGSLSDQVGNIYEVCQNMTSASPIADQNKYFLTGMSTDYTLTNIGVGTSEVDVYEFIARRDFTWSQFGRESGGGATDLSIRKMLEEVTNSETQMPGAGAAMTFGNLGWVPTDANQAMKNIIILSKQRYYIGAGQAVSFVKRTRFKKPVSYDSTNMRMAVDINGLIAGTPETQDFILKARKGITRGIIVIYRGLPSAASAADAVNIAYNAQTRYSMKFLDMEDNKNALGT